MEHVINLLNSPIIGKKSPFSFVPLLVKLGINSLIVGKLFNLPLGFGVTASAENFMYLVMTRCMVPGCDGMIKYEKKIPSKEELWDKYYMGAPEQQRQFVEQYKIVKRA